MDPRVVETRPFDDQKPGTAGLRKPVSRFATPNYLENFLQSVFDCVPGLHGATLVAGGDGRYYNDTALQTLLRIAAGNGVARMVVGKAGLLSTPAASHLIPLCGAAGGFILSASHNPGGPQGDFGIKFNLGTGGQASETLTDAIHARSREIDRYRILALPELALDRTGRFRHGPMEVEIRDPVSDHADLMERLFDFDRIADLLRSRQFSMRFDAMHAVTGPYARELFIRRLGAPEDALLNAVPQPDFGGTHPDPNPHDAHEFFTGFMHDDAPDFGAASDGDGDRNMILGRNTFVSPGDSLAVLAANASLIPAFRDGLKGLARSMPTSRAVDRVADHLGVPLYETPTGWRFFCNLLDAGRVSICGEESFGTSSDHCREKDGLWAVLAWLNLLAVTGESVSGLLRRHWSRFGRHYYQRQDYFLPESESGQELMRELVGALPALAGRSLGGSAIAHAHEFEYEDPVDGSYSAHQGIVIESEGGERAIFRLSGTGTRGATLRLYLESFEPDPARHNTAPAARLAPLAQAARQVARLKELAGVERPVLVT